MKKTILLAVVALTLGACAAIQEAQELDATIAAAEKEIAVANKLGFTWRDTEQHLKDAQKLKEENPELAMKLAKRALNEAKLAQEQAKVSATDKPHFH